MAEPHEALKRLQEVKNYYSSAIQQGGAFTNVSYAEMEVIVSAVIDAISFLGSPPPVGALGQPRVQKRGWEHHG